MTTRTEEWTGCYETGWKGWIVPDAFSHPAKFSRCLIERIYDHAFEMGWVQQGSVVLDPFGGVALGGLCAMSMGLHWVGVELEEKFVKLGEQNIELWNKQLASLPNLGTARIIQGDSRKLNEVVKKADLMISSPPYSDIDKGYGHRPNRWSKVKNNPNFKGRLHWKDDIDRPSDYGHTPGNLANMKEGSIDAVITSPPYADQPIQKNSGSIDRKKQYQAYRSQGGGASFEAFCKTQELHSGDYGQSPGQLGSMKEGNFDICVSSPPYEGSQVIASGVQRNELNWKSGKDLSAGKSKHYGKTEGNLGETSGDTFWSSSREIVQQCYELLKNGGEPVSDEDGIDFCEGHNE